MRFTVQNKQTVLNLILASFTDEDIQKAMDEASERARTGAAATAKHEVEMAKLKLDLEARDGELKRLKMELNNKAEDIEKKNGALEELQKVVEDSHIELEALQSTLSEREAEASEKLQHVTQQAAEQAKLSSEGIEKLADERKDLEKTRSDANLLTQQLAIAKLDIERMEKQVHLEQQAKGEFERISSMAQAELAAATAKEKAEHEARNKVEAQLEETGRTLVDTQAMLLAANAAAGKSKEDFEAAILQATQDAQEQATRRAQQEMDNIKKEAEQQKEQAEIMRREAIEDAERKFSEVCNTEMQNNGKIFSLCAQPTEELICFPVYRAGSCAS